MRGTSKARLVPFTTADLPPSIRLCGIGRLTINLHACTPPPFAYLLTPSQPTNHGSPTHGLSFGLENRVLATYKQLWNRATYRCRSCSRRTPRRNHRALAAAALGRGSSLPCRTRTKEGRRRLVVMVAALEVEGCAALRGSVGHPLGKGEMRNLLGVHSVGFVDVLWR